jgi:UDP-N-acetylglucosamine 4,6-dehydratase
MAADFPGLRYVLGDVRDKSQVAAAVAGHDIVIHAAAMKRIPECEAFPSECMKTNVVGSQNVIDACLTGGVRRCVGISTDKACAAITTYGASKRVMEGLFQQADLTGRLTTFTLVRYGNVVASNGSVIPVWQQQAKEGGPLTITGGEMTRFWMSRFHAVELIERALIMDPGTISVPKMGALSIREMASIIAPNVPLQDIGLRSREKIHEDLVNPNEAAAPDGLSHFTIRNSNDTGGISYNSLTARRLMAWEFQEMLDVA